MKFTAAVAAAAALAMASSAEGASMRGESAGSRDLSGRRGCRNDFKCPTNSYRTPGRECYNDFDDCSCDKGFDKVHGECLKELDIAVNNLSFQQPFSSFFVMVHSKDAQPLYRQGQPASTPLAILAEDGNPDALVRFYRRQFGVLSVDAIAGPLLPAGRTSFKVRVNDDYDRVTIATMAINTNDCFASVNGVALQPGDVLDLPGLDAGSEENNELCSSIPGPACAPSSGNVRSGNGEGFVHVHRGFHGINEGEKLRPEDNGANGAPLSAVGYDWRNPLMRVSVAGHF